MVDQSHNLKGKIEAMIQTVRTAQELWAKAALVDRAGAGRSTSRPATSCRPSAASPTRSPPTRGRSSRRGPPRTACRPIPIAAFRESGYLETITRERGARNLSSVTSYA